MFLVLLNELKKPLSESSYPYWILVLCEVPTYKFNIPADRKRSYG